MHFIMCQTSSQDVMQKEMIRLIRFVPLLLGHSYVTVLIRMYIYVKVAMFPLLLFLTGKTTPLLEIKLLMPKYQIHKKGML